MRTLTHTAKAVLIVVTAFVFALTPVSDAHAVTGADWRAGNITDDVVFYNNHSMTVEQIQQFLNARVPSCDNWGTQSYAGTTRRAYSEARGIKFPLTCVKDYYENTSTKENNLEGRGIPAGAKSAAQIISDAAHEFRINPQALIVLLQKEQALIMDDWPWPVQYRSATGYGCPDTAPCDAEYYGFYNQVRSAARQFRIYANNPNAYNHIPDKDNQVRFNPSASCGSSTVRIENMATASLYNYTPYQPNQAALNNLYGTGDSCSAYGNRNYWRQFNDWFGNTKTTAKWLRQSTANGQVWLVVEGQMPNGSYARKKWKMMSNDIYAAYGLQFEPVGLVSEEYLAQFTDDGVLGTIGTSKSYAQFQLVDSFRRYFVAGIEYCAKNGDGSTNTNTTWGIDCFNTNIVKTFPGNEFLERVPGHGQLKTLLTDKNNVTYKLSGGKKLPFYDAQTFTDMGYNWSTSTTVMQDINAQQPLGPLQISHAAVLSFNNGPFLVYDNKTFKFHNAGNLDTFGAWALHTLVKRTPQSSYDTSPPTIYDPLTIWATDGNRKFIIDDGRKIDVTAAITDMPNVTWQTTATDILDSLPTAGYGSYVWDKQTGGVYKIESGKKRLVPNWENFVGLGLQIPQLLPLNHSTIVQIPDGELKLAPGSLFQTSSGVHMVTGSGGSLHIPQWNYFRHFNLNLNSLIHGSDNLTTTYAANGELSTAMQANDGWRYIVSDGKRYVVGESIRAAWGIPTSTFKSSDTSTVNRTPLAGEFGKFFIYQGSIYYADGGQKHHVGSWNSYLALGGGQLITVEADLFNTIPSGNPIP